MLYILNLGTRIGKLFFSGLCLIITLDLSANIQTENIKLDLEEIQKISIEEFLNREKEIDISVKKYLSEKVKGCVDENRESEVSFDQAECFKEVKRFKIGYINLKYKKKNDLLIESFNAIKGNLRLIHQEKIKLIQDSSPEEEKFVEL